MTQIPLYLAAAHSRGRQEAEDWLERNTPESFEEDSRDAARRWMDEHADEYEEWHPRENDYTYEGLGDAAGQQFTDYGDYATAMPGHFRTENVRLHQNPNHPSWEDSDIEISREPLTHQFPDDHEDMDGVEDDDDVDSEFEKMARHGFNWEALDPSAGTPGNPLSPETPGRYVRHQRDPEGNHIATHVIQEHAGTRYPSTNLPLWTVDSNIVGGEPKRTNHTSADNALDRYRQNSAEILLPSRGYEPDRGRTGWVRSWHRTDPSAQDHHDHVIDFPDFGEDGGPDGFSGTSHSRRTGEINTHHSYDLSDVVREHDRLGGLHGE